MRDFIYRLFEERSGNKYTVIELFNAWHIAYILIIIGLIVMAAFVLKNKSKKAQKITLDIILTAVIVSQVANFFITPLFEYNGEIDIDKLPFHICTSISIISAIARFNKYMHWLKAPAVPLSILSCIIYLCYPGSALGNISALSYTVLQTFFFHGALLAYGVLCLTTKEVTLQFKNIWKELCLIVAIALWAGFGCFLFNGRGDHHYDWFFLTGSTFGIVPKEAMPFIIVGGFFMFVAMLYGLVYLIRYIRSKKHPALAAEIDAETSSPEEAPAESPIEESATVSETEAAETHEEIPETPAEETQEISEEN